MKRVKITGGGKEAIVSLNWENRVTEACNVFNIKVGDDLSVHFRNHRDAYHYENIPVYTKPYHPAEKLSWMLAKNLKLQGLINRFSLVLSV
jgi:hypothetical protein